VWKLGDGSLFSLPAFSLPKPSLDAAVAIMPIAMATIPESVAHVYQLDIYVNGLAQKKGTEKRYPIKEHLGENLIGDGCSDMICGLIGGPAGTSYGENMSTMLISRVFSISVLLATSIILMVLSCFAPLIQVIYCIPIAVIGGLEVYLFGAIAVQGIAILVQSKCDVFSTRNVAVISTVLIIGLGGNYAFDGVIPFFGMEVPAISAAAVFGILLNWVLGLRSRGAEESGADSQDGDTD
jgi:uracil permease